MKWSMEAEKYGGSREVKEGRVKQGSSVGYV